MKISASQRQRIGVSTSIFLAFCIILRFSSAEEEETTEGSPRQGGTELKCCICNFRYVGDRPLEQCNCHSNPSARNCTRREWLYVVATPGKKSMSEKTTGESCFAYTSYQNKTNSVWFTRTTFPTGAIPGAHVTDNCTWMDVNTYNTEDGFTTKKVCECKKDYCNCDPVTLSFIGEPDTSTVCASYDRVELLLIALLSVVASKSFQ